MNRDTVLIVDDEEINRMLLVESVKEEYEIVEAANGEEALDLLFNQGIIPAAILLDIIMPGMNGYEVIEKIKNSVETQNIPVLFITALDGDTDESRGLKAGAADYIPKPINPDIVRTRLNSHVALNQYNNQLERLVEEKTKEVMRTYEQTLEVLASIIEYRNLESGEHIRRTSMLTEMLIKHLVSSNEYKVYHSRLVPGVAHSIVKATALHDIGKIGIPDEILLKKGKLTEEEFEVMKTHTTIGRDIVDLILETLGDSAKYLTFSREICFYHHERWDGRGYPCGLSGEEIPLSARLLSIVDVYDALVNTRVYKPPFTHKEAVKIITEGRGTQFDPLLVDAFTVIADQFAELEERMKD